MVEMVKEAFASYRVKKVITQCPHCFNTIKNEYPALGGKYEVIPHSQFLQQLHCTVGAQAIAVKVVRHILRHAFGGREIVGELAPLRVVYILFS